MGTGYRRNLVCSFWPLSGDAIAVYEIGDNSVNELTQLWIHSAYVYSLHKHLLNGYHILCTQVNTADALVNMSIEQIVLQRVACT